ncbi:MAG: hypothetical protein FWB73_05810 [Treponema sp.]|nr:hypothetical protein [Treponema sp.]
MKTRLVYLNVPESFKSKYGKSSESFSIDPNIPIPVEVPEDIKNLNNLDLSMEMIIRGMLRAIEEKEVKQKWIDYYSAFVLYLRPDILEIVQNEMDHRITRINANEKM